MIGYEESKQCFYVTTFEETKHIRFCSSDLNFPTVSRIEFFHNRIESVNYVVLLNYDITIEIVKTLGKCLSNPRGFQPLTHYDGPKK